MKILYHHRIKSMDGQYVHIEELIAQLKALGHDVQLVGPVSESSVRFGGESKVLEVIKKVFPRFIYELLECGYSVFDFVKLALAVRRFRPEVIYERFNLLTPSGIWAKRVFGLPLILEVNAPLFEERSKYGGVALKRLAMWTQWFTWRGADAVIVVTSVLKRTVQQYGVADNRIHIMSNGVDSDHFQVTETQRQSIRDKLGIANRFVIGFTGFVRDWHGLDRILEILSEPAFNNAVLLVVGDGPAREALVARAEELGVNDRFAVTGVVNRQEVPAYISSFDVAIQPNVVAYASPLKVLEYLSMGRAIIAPDLPNIREILRDRHNALLFDNSDPQHLKELLEAVMRDTALRQRLESAAHRTISEHGLTWRRNAERVGELMLQIAH
jgi:glycosyltransferase involved in cell wall biosynthesis